MKLGWSVMAAVGLSVAGIVAACGDADRDSGGPLDRGGDGGNTADETSGNGGVGVDAKSGNGAGGALMQGAGGEGATEDGPPSSGGTAEGGSSSGGTGEIVGTAGGGGDGYGGSAASSGAGGASNGGSYAVGGGENGDAANGGMGDGGNESIGGSGGAGGSGPEIVCGDGVLSPGESCCTREWLDEELAFATKLAGLGLAHVTTCIGPQEQLGTEICGSPACDGGATGCRTEITNETIEYHPETRDVTGTVDVVISGRLSAQVLSLTQACNFTATIDDLAYRADVITVTTPENVRIRLGDPDLDYTIDISGCGLLSDVADFVLNGPTREFIEAPIRQAIIDQLKFTEQCPY